MDQRGELDDAVDWDRWEAAIRANGVAIDRPKGSSHPRFPASRYPTDYGYLPGTSGGDGQEIDVFVGSASGRGLVGLIATHDGAKDDDEIKLLWNLTGAEAAAVLAFVNRGQMTGRLLARPPDPITETGKGGVIPNRRPARLNPPDRARRRRVVSTRSTI